MLLASGHPLPEIMRMSFEEIAFCAGCIWMSRAHLINVLLSPLIEGSGEDGEEVAYKPASVRQERKQRIKKLPSRKGTNRYQIRGVPQPAPAKPGATDAERAAREALRWQMFSNATGIPIRTLPPAPPQQDAGAGGAPQPPGEAPEGVE